MIQIDRRIVFVFLVLLIGFLALDYLAYTLDRKQAKAETELRITLQENILQAIASINTTLASVHRATDEVQDTKKIVESAKKDLVTIKEEIVGSGRPNHGIP